MSYPSGRWDEVLVCESEDVIINLLELNLHFRDIFLRARRVLLFSCFLCCVQFVSILSAISAADWASF